MYVGDIARGLAACALYGEPGETYNLASGAETSIMDLALRINALTGNPAPVALKPAREWDRSGQRFGDPTKAREKLGFTAEIPHDDGLRLTIQWTIDYHDTILGCVMQHVHFMPELKEYTNHGTTQLAAALD